MLQIHWNHIYIYIYIYIYRACKQHLVSEHVKPYLCFVLILNENSCYYDLSKLFKQWLLKAIQRVGVILSENAITGVQQAAIQAPYQRRSGAACSVITKCRSRAI